LRDVTEEDAAAMPSLCTSGFHFVSATRSQLAQLRQAVAPIYRQLARSDPLFNEVRSLGERTADTSKPLRCPASKPGTADTTGIDGIYAMTLTRAEAARCGMEEQKYPQTLFTLRLHEGAVDMTEQPGGPSHRSQTAWVGGYSVYHDTLRVTGDYTLSMTWRRHGRQLVLSALRGGGCGDRAVWTLHPWAHR
jgi:hypothetical protein